MQEKDPKQNAVEHIEGRGEDNSLSRWEGNSRTYFMLAFHLAMFYPRIEEMVTLFTTSTSLMCSFEVSNYSLS